MDRNVFFIDKNSEFLIYNISLLSYINYFPLVITHSTPSGLVFVNFSYPGFDPGLFILDTFGILLRSLSVVALAKED
jgi:hypothetical protein